MQFYYVYKTLAHPETNGYVSPYSLQERLLHVQEARRSLRTQFQWICDTMTNDVKHALGDAPNSEFVTDPDGIVVRKRVWSRPAQLRSDLEELVGPVEQPTDPNELDVGFTDDVRQVATDVVQRVKPAAATRPLRIEPLESEDGMPFYVKLRAEADDDLLKTGQGEMYLGFHLDPIYGVHWNNRSEPLGFELAPPDGTEVTPAAATAPRVEVAADADPREFLVQVNGAGDEPLRLTVRYFACDDAETFCVPVSQQYAIHWDVDPEGGWVFARGSRPTGGARDENPRASTAEALRRQESRRQESRRQEFRRRFADRFPENTDRSPEASEATTETDDPGEDDGSPAAATLSGRFRGRLRGSIDGQLKGSFRGELRGELVGAAALTIDGRFEGQIEGRLQGEIDGDFEGEFNGTLGGPR